MKVLIIDVNCKHSSTGRIVYDLYTHLKENSHEVRVCYGRGPLIKEPDIYKFSSNIEVYFHALMTRITGLTGIYSPFATRRLIKLIEEFQPNVVHIHELHAYFVNISPLLKYLKINNIKTVWTFHCEFMYTGKCGHAYECEKWKSECGQCPQVKEYPKSFFFDFTRAMHRDKIRLFRDFNNLIIVTPSEWLANRVKQSFLKNKDIRVIHNGIDTQNVFYPRQYEDIKQKYNIKDERIVLAVASNLMSENKGGQWVLELARRFKNENIKFFLIGVDDIDIVIRENVIMLGRTKDQQELAKYYSLADVTILPSKKETFSLVCAESLACGTPVIGFEAGAPSEIAPSGHGVFIPYGNIDEMKKKIESIFNGSNVLDSREEHVEFSRSNYSNANMTESYMKLYTDISYKK